MCGNCTLWGGVLRFWAIMTLSSDVKELVATELPAPIFPGEAKLHREHPRLLITESDWRNIRERRAREPEFAEICEGVVRRARAAAELPPIERKLTGRRLLYVSQEALRRVFLHVASFRLTSDRAFVEAARREMLAAADFSDWNPDHFLDTAELTAALAVGYDGLWDVLDIEARNRIRAAIRDLGLRPALEQKASRFFYRARNNWNQVCLGGLALGALAIAEDEPDLANRMLAEARRHIGNGLSAYAPDGVYPEGPVYWRYGTSYQIALIEAFRTALGTDDELPRAPGFLESSDFMLHMRGPFGQYFNFADSSHPPIGDPSFLWFARERNRPSIARFVISSLRRVLLDSGATKAERWLPLVLKWWPTPGKMDSEAPPLFWSGGGPNPVAAWRTAWDDPAAVYFAVKGGGATVNHGHLDAGSFVFDAGGVRWAEDLGLQDYESLERLGVRLWDGKPGGQRWQIFRLNNHSHNTLTIEGGLHRPDALATFARADAGGAEIDLSPVFRGAAAKVTRGVRWRGVEGVEIEDRLEGLRPGAEVRWSLVTSAEAQIRGNAFQLFREGRALEIEFDATAPRLTVESIEKPGGFNAENPGRRRLDLFTTADANGRAAIRAALRPLARAEAKAAGRP